MPPKQLIILGGPNGAGKSSAHAELERLGFVTGPFLNPDDIAREFDGAPSTRDIRAGRETLRRVKLWIREGRTFTRESTLTSSEMLRSMQMARDIGYRVILVFVGIDSVEAGKARVQSRVLHGGHDIASEVQDRRFAKSFANARRAASIVNTAYFVDNASSLRYVHLGGARPRALCGRLGHALAVAGARRLATSGSRFDAPRQGISARVAPRAPATSLAWLTAASWMPAAPGARPHGNGL